MSLPERPGAASPPYEQRNAYRQSPQRRSRPHDVETGAYYPMPNRLSAQHQRAPSGQSFPETIRNPDLIADNQPLSPTLDHPRNDGGGVPTRKRSLIRPERNRIDKDHPNYHYRQHAAQMDTLPSSTGNNPIPEDVESGGKRSGDRSVGATSDSSPPRKHGDASTEKSRSRAHDRQRRRSGSHKIAKKSKDSKRSKAKEVIRPPSVWNVYCAIVTFWCPDFILKCFGFRSKAKRRAWREKMGLISIIVYLMAIIGFLTFGFTATVCESTSVRLHANNVGSGFMIFHGKAYNLVGASHPPADGIPLRQDNTYPNILWDIPGQSNEGKDGSFLFQSVNGKCKGLITRTADSDIPTNSNGDLGWYFPCKAIDQDGSSKPDFDWPHYTGYACHTTQEGRDTFYMGLKSTGDVFYT